MANTLRGIYGSDVLIATGNSFTGNVLKAGYTEKMAGDMIMPNGLAAYSSKMSGAELKEIIKNFVEGYEGGFIPFNRGSLPVVSGISVEINETEDGYTLSKVTKDGKAVRDEDTFTVTCLATPQHMETYPVDENMIFDGGATSVKDTWTAYFSYRFVLHKYTVIVSASSFSALFPPQLDRSDTAVTITKNTDKTLLHFFFFITSSPNRIVIVTSMK